MSLSLISTSSACLHAKSDFSKENKHYICIIQNGGVTKYSQGISGHATMILYSVLVLFGGTQLLLASIPCAYKSVIPKCMGMI